MNIRCLIVEDDALARIILETMLRRLGIEVIAAPSGESALELMRDQSVQFMLLDISLGYGMSGIDLMLKFRNDPRFKDMPIIAVTAHTFKELEKYMFHDGFSEYLQKPYEIEELTEILTKHEILTQEAEYIKPNNK